MHGDTHLENIFFGEQFEGGAMFIDFGLTALGHPLSDISELLGTGMRPKVPPFVFIPSTCVNALHLCSYPPLV